MSGSMEGAWSAPEGQGMETWMSAGPYCHWVTLVKSLLSEPISSCVKEGPNWPVSVWTLAVRTTWKSKTSTLGTHCSSLAAVADPRAHRHTEDTDMQEVGALLTSPEMLQIRAALLPQLLEKLGSQSRIH